MELVKILAKKSNERRSLMTNANARIAQGTFEFADNRPDTIAQSNLLSVIHNNSHATVQRQPMTNGPLQMAKVPPAAIREGDWAHVGSGSTLHFTALAAGCLAVVAEFDGGGGAGVHLAMLMQPEPQWSQFRDAIAAKRISAVHLYGDMVGQAQGWYVKQQGGVPQTEMSPRSAWMLNGAQASQNGANDWVWAEALVRNWFQETLGAGVALTVTNGAVDHVCP